MYKLVNGQLLNIIEVVTPNQIALVTTTTHSVKGYDSDVAIDIESIPEKNELPRKIGELHYTNGVLEWVYVDQPLTLDQENIDTMLALTESYEMILQLQSRIEQLELKSGGTV